VIFFFKISLNIRNEMAYRTSVTSVLITKANYLHHNGAGEVRSKVRLVGRAHSEVELVGR
jgi:hypothetical protein